MTVDLSTLQLGRKLGDGGQAEVFAVSNHSGLAFKRYRPEVQQTLRADVLEDLTIEARHLKLEGRPITYWATWPTESVKNGSRVVGFLMPLLDDRFMLSEGNLIGKPANFAYLACRPAPFWGSVSLPSLYERVRFLAQLAGILQQLHHRRMVFGDLSWGNVLWAQYPTSRVILLDCDGIRLPRGAPVSKQLDSPDWNDPLALPGSVPDTDRDCYKFALMALRVLGQNLTARPSGSEKYLLHGLTTDVADTVNDLLARAAGPVGSRPSATEWRHALQGRAALKLRQRRPIAVETVAGPSLPPSSERQWRPITTTPAPDLSTGAPVMPHRTPHVDGERRWTPVDPLEDLL